MALHVWERLTKIPKSIQSSLRWVEWMILLGVCILEVAHPDAANRENVRIIFLLFALMWLGTSFIFPIDRPLWQRRVYIAGQLLLTVLARSFDVGIDLLLYLVIIKSCFLFNRRDVILIAILGGIGWILPLNWLLPHYLEKVQQQVQDGIDYNLVSASKWFGEIATYSITSIFVVLMGFLVVREHQSQEQIKLLNQEVESLGTLLERTRIARNIHDTLGHTLTDLGMQLEVAQQLCLCDPDQTGQRLKMAKRLSDQCLQEIRQVVQALRQSNFDLTQGLTGLITHLQHTQPLETQVQLNLPNLPLQTSYQLYCIIQEGVTNIQKHAKASHVSLRTALTADSLTLELGDNGQGFDPTQPPQGFGLQGMRERAQLIGGLLQIQTQLGKGTCLRVTLCYQPIGQLP
jgi:signal transduction histidine kinase